MQMNQCLVNDYMRPWKDSDKYDERLQFLKDFLKDETLFEPTYQAKKNIVGDFVLPLYGHNRYGFTDERMREWVGRSFRYGDVKNIRQKVDYQYSSTAGRECAVHTIYADVRINGKYEKRRSGGIAFALESFVKRKTKL